MLVLLFQNMVIVNADCAPGCYDSWPGDTVCDSACNNAACNWDGGDCDDDTTTTCSSWFCDSSKLGDGTCNYFCSGPECNYDNGDCNEKCDYTNECSLDKIGEGRCGIFAQATDKWCEFDGSLVCCSDESDFSDCCESNPTVISITVLGIFLLVALPSIWAWRRNRRDNTKDNPPNCCYKLCCPICAIIGHQGCESKMDFVLSYFCCCFFTLCCWTPKAVVVVVENNKDNTYESLEMAVVHVENCEKNNP